MTYIERQMLEAQQQQEDALTEEPAKPIGTAKKAGRPKGTTVARKEITEKEFDILIEYIDRSPLSEKMKLRHKRTAVLSFYLGTRIGELLLLKVKDIRHAVIDLETSLTNRTKTKKPRLLMFTKNAIPVIRFLFAEYLDPDHAAKHDPGHYIFSSPRKPSKPLNKATWTTTMNALIHEALGPLYSSHSFREGFISDLARKRINPRVAQRLVGHSNVSTTMSYFKPTLEDARLALDEIR